MLNSHHAMYHATFKSEVRKDGPPSKDGGHGELRKKFQMVYKSFDPRGIQKGFMRSYSRNDFGDLDEALIPSSFRLVLGRRI